MYERKFLDGFDKRMRIKIGERMILLTAGVWDLKYGQKAVRIETGGPDTYADQIGQPFPMSQRDDFELSAQGDIKQSISAYELQHSRLTNFIAGHS